MAIEKDGEEAKSKENKYYEDRMREMKKGKHELKQQQVEDEKKYFEKTERLEEYHAKKQKYTVDENDDNLVNMEKKYQ